MIGRPDMMTKDAWRALGSICVTYHTLSKKEVDTLEKEEKDFTF